VEYRSDGEVPAKARGDKRRALLRPPSINFCSLLQQVRHNVSMAVCGGRIQSIPKLAPADIDDGAVLDDKLDGAKMAAGRRRLEGRSESAARRVDIESRLLAKEEPERLRKPKKRRVVKPRAMRGIFRSFGGSVCSGGSGGAMSGGGGADNGSVSMLGVFLNEVPP
jgi:uncharacterized membrane protein YgcG